MNTSCEFNIDTASVELRFADGTGISIYTLEVDDEICPTVSIQTEIDWLIYNDASDIFGLTQKVPKKCIFAVFKTISALIFNTSVNDNSNT